MTNTNDTNINDNLNNVIDDDAFEITGNPKKNTTKSKAFKFVIPTLIVGALVTVGLLISLFVQPTDKKAKTENLVSLDSSINESSNLSLDEFLSSESPSLDGASDIDETEDNLDNELENEESMTFTLNDYNADNTANDSNTYTNDSISSNTISYYNYTTDNKNSSTISYTGTDINSLCASIDISSDVANSSTKIPLFLQADYRWGSNSYAGSTVSHLGSGATCLSMVCVYLTKNYNYHPLKMISLSTNSGQVDNGVGTNPSFMNSGASSLGLKVKEVKSNKNAIINEIIQRKPVIAYMKPGSFSSTYSYIVIRNYTFTEFMIHDPNSQSNSNIKWKYKDITNNIEKAWSYSK